MVAPASKFSIRSFQVHYGRLSALRNLDLDILANEIFTVIYSENNVSITYINY